MPAPKRLTIPRHRSIATRRVVEYINDRFEGNIALAAAMLDCDYDALYAMVKGLRRKPTLSVLQALSVYSLNPIEYWLDEEGK
jgi:hypothetical protein